MVKSGTVIHQINISAYGVRVSVSTNRKELVPAIARSVQKALAGNLRLERTTSFDHSVSLVRENGGYCFSKDDETKYLGPDVSFALERVEPELRLTVAEHAPKHAFIHAGAVSWKGKGIIFPARSFRGKSTLTAALVKLGARYYSDEYAILDEKGRLHPFAKDLSLRGHEDEYLQIDTSVSSLGGKEGKRPVPVKMIVITEFKPKTKWNPRRISSGTAVMELINNSVSIRVNPTFVMPVLTIVANGAISIKTKRGDAETAARRIIELIEMES
jgi:hypothetical protein